MAEVIRFPAAMDVKACVQHGHMATDPCPWPNCENGIDAEEFELYLGPHTLGRRSRTKWTLLDGDTAYSWHSSDLPYTLEVRDIVSSDGRRHHGTAANVPGTLYHYTTTESLLSIVQEGDLRLTDYSYLNDIKEIQFGAELAEQELEEFVGRLSNRTGAATLERAVDSLGSGRPRICVFSMSADGDSLSQWRAYGAPGNRVAIGVVPFSRFLRPDFSSLGPVIYERRDQIRVLKLCFDLYHQAHLMDLENETLLSRKIDFATFLVTMLYSHITRFKDTAFRDEREFRLVYVEDQSMLRAWRKPVPKKGFTTRGGLIVPYVSLRNLHLFEGEEPPRLQLSEVVIGPQTSTGTLERGIRELLDAHGHAETEIRASSVALR